MRLIPKGEPVTDTRIISNKRMTIAQRNDLCTGCHAKKTALTGAYFPGERFFDHYDDLDLQGTQTAYRRLKIKVKSVDRPGKSFRIGKEASGKFDPGSHHIIAA